MFHTWIVYRNYVTVDCIGYVIWKLLSLILGGQPPEKLGNLKVVRENVFLTEVWGTNLTRSIDFTWLLAALSIHAMWFAQEYRCHTYDMHINIVVMCMLHSCTDCWWSSAEYKVDHQAGITTCCRVCIWICKSERPTKSYCCT